MKTTNNKKKALLMLGILMLGIFVISINFVSAEYKACFTKGDKYTYCTNQDEIDLPYCNSAYCICERTQCNPCFKSYDPINKCYVGGNSAVCLKMPTNCSSNSTGGGMELDVTPPQLIIKSPIKNTIYNSKKLYLNFSLNEVADVYYRDLNKSTVSWTRICTQCIASQNSYAKQITFKEGNNTLMFKAVDGRGNTAYSNISFFTDSVFPRTYTTYPKANSFADGNFEVQFKEVNPKKLTLYYGSDKTTLDLKKCNYAMGKQICEIDVDLKKYHGQTIGYYFEVEDIAGNKYSSRNTLVKVDTKAPVVNNPNSFFKITNNRYVEFNISVNEENLYKITSTNMNNPRASATTMCTRLTNGYCYKKQSFTKGNYSLSIEISDKAGHIIAVPATFTINY